MWAEVDHWDEYSEEAEQMENEHSAFESGKEFSSGRVDNDRE